MEEQLERLLEILLEILPTSTGQLETIQATKKLPKIYTNTFKLSLKVFETCQFFFIWKIALQSLLKRKQQLNLIFLIKTLFLHYYLGPAS